MKNEKTKKQHRKTAINAIDLFLGKESIGYFSNRYRMIALDTRGHGKSPRGTAPFSINRFSDDLNEFMVSQGISNAIILGFSDGANIEWRKYESAWSKANHTNPD